MFDRETFGISLRRAAVSDTRVVKESSGSAAYSNFTPEPLDSLTTWEQLTS
jgi:hypothetical protein